MIINFILKYHTSNIKQEYNIMFKSKILVVLGAIEVIAMCCEKYLSVIDAF